jgi:hypothetical protein
VASITNGLVSLPSANYRKYLPITGPVNKLLSWKALIPLSRLTYCVYLTHLTYQILQATSARTPIYIGDLTEVNLIEIFGGTR